MTRWKKITLGIFVLLLVAGAALFYINGKDHYDPSKYNASVTGGLEQGGLQKGSQVNLTLPDQFDKSHTIGPEITTLLLAFSKTSGGLVREYLDQKSSDLLTSHNTTFIADISPYPVVLRNTFALPLLRKSSYPVLLIYETAISDALQNPNQTDKVTVARLRAGVVQSVRYIDSNAQLDEVFE